MTVSETDIKKITDILNEEVAIKRRLRDIKNIKAFYQDELSELSATMHQTRDGVIMFVSQMSEDHLIATVRVYLTNGTDLRSVPKKYLNEVEKRGLIDKILLTSSILSSRNGLDDDEPLDDEDFFEV